MAMSGVRLKLVCFAYISANKHKTRVLQVLHLNKFKEDDFSNYSKTFPLQNE